MQWIGKFILIAGLLALAACRPASTENAQNTSSEVDSDAGDESSEASSDESNILPSPTPPATLTPDAYSELDRPERIRIGAIEVDAEIEQLALSDSAIGVPADWSNAGWFQDGFRPGEPGRAVISGHFDDDAGQAAVFYRLGELEIGESIEVDNAGQTFTYRVIESMRVPFDASDDATMEAVFGPADMPMLSLITCDGAWNAAAGTYDQRLIVIAELDD